MLLHDMSVISSCNFDHFLSIQHVKIYNPKCFVQINKIDIFELVDIYRFIAILDCNKKNYNGRLFTKSWENA